MGVFQGRLNIKTGNIVKSTETEANGHYIFYDIGAGNYTGEVTGNGYQTRYFTFVVRGGTTNHWPEVAVTPVFVVRNLIATATSPSTVSLSWANVNGAASYKIYYSTTSGAASGSAFFTSTENSYTHTGLTNGTTYYYVVRAVDSSGQESAPGNEVAATPHAGFIENFNSQSSFEERWTYKQSKGCCGAGNLPDIAIVGNKLKVDVNGGLDGYMGISDAGYLVPNISSISGDFEVIMSFEESYRMRTNGYKDNSGLSLIISTSDNKKDGILSISIAGNHSGYFPGYSYNQYEGHRVGFWSNDQYVRLDELNLNELYKLKFKIVRIGNTFTIGYQLDGEISWHTESVQIDNVDSIVPMFGFYSGDGGNTRENGKFGALIDSFEITKDFSPPLPGEITPPANLSATSADAEVSLKWTPVNGAASYNVYYSTVAGTASEGQVVDSTSNASFVHAGLTNSTTYYYVVRAVDSLGQALCVNLDVDSSCPR